MSRSAPQPVTTTPVSPGTSVLQSVYTTVGFNAGDYVYTYGANLVGWPKGSTTTLGSTNTIIAGTQSGGGVATVDSRSASYGPFSDVGTYNGTTTTIGSINVSPVTLGTYTSAPGVKTAVLTNGNIAVVYNSAANTVTGAIYNSAGVLQGSTVTLTTTAYLSYPTRAISVCADPSGGYIFAFINSNDLNAWFVRVNSSNAITYGPAQAGANNIYAYINVTCSPNYFCISGVYSPGSAPCYSWYFNLSTNGYLGQYNFSGSQVYSIASVGLNNNKFITYIGDSGYGYIRVYLVNPTNQVVQSTSNMGSFNGSYPEIDACGVTESTATGSSFTGYNNSLVTWIDNSGYPNWYRFNTNTAGTGIVNQGGSSIGLPASGVVGISTGSNGEGFVYYRSSSTGYLNYLYLNNSNSVSSYGTLVSSLLNSGYQFGGAAGLIGSKSVVAYIAPSTNYPTFLLMNTANYTNGVTQLTGSTSYVPSSGYYLMGIAATTTAANSTGAVIVNGQAQLGSSYPTVTSQINFDYSGTATTARSAITGNNGSVVGTTVTLKGLQ